MAPRFGFVSTYPPTQCGLATFTASLLRALVSTGASSGGVVRLVDSDDTVAPRPVEVVAELAMGDLAAIAPAAAALNGCDAVIVQHEFGVFGGPDGADVLSLLAALRVPSIVVVHTVLVTPTAHQRQVLEAVVAAADSVVTMTKTAHDRLIAGYCVDPSKVCIIPHGAPDVAAASTARPAPATSTVLTWGLLGPGKGIEWGIAAMALLGDLRPAPRYVVAGQTHPKVLLREGEAYRDRLRAQARRAGVQSTVHFDGRYRDAAALAELVASADIVLLPYDSTEQVTSGVLIEAVAAGKPVVATGFPHAVELLADGAGVVVAHRDPVAIAAALRTVLTHHELAATMSHAGACAAPQVRWPAVAARYCALAAELITASLAA